MKNFCLCCASIFSLLTILYAGGTEKLDCLEREKAIASLETAEDLLSKAEDSFPDCEEDSNSTNQSECGGKKPLAYIEITKKLISDVRENFPTCPKVIVQYVKHKDCSEILASGRKESGVYTIWPSESNNTGTPLQVYCDMETDGGGWAMIQRRGKFPVQQDFMQDWETYKHGFGNITEEFWLGNENIRILCQEGCEIRFDLQDFNGTKGFAHYQNFHLSSIYYSINTSDYKGDIGECMGLDVWAPFSTKDNNTFAEIRKAGWWYTQADDCNLNGIYLPFKTNRTSDEISEVAFIHWSAWRRDENLSSSEIKVRPK